MRSFEARTRGRGARLVDEPGATLPRRLADGVLTRLNTFQKFYEQTELRNWIASILDEEPLAAAPGVFYVFRDPALRASFAASRFRRTPSALPRRRELTPELRQLLAPLETFASVRGRAPLLDEPGDWSPIIAEFGSLRRAFQRLYEPTDQVAWQLIRKARADDLLVYLALSRFEGRLRASALPCDLRADIDAFFGSHAKACTVADALLFSLGDRVKVERACREAGFGKLMPNALYVSASAVGDLPILLRLFEGCARNYVGVVSGANIIKLARQEAKVSYLSYPAFERDPHPALVASTSVDLQTFSIRQRRYEAANPPILHRKEEFLPPGHPLRPKFARLTRAEEVRGLYEHPSLIGTRRGWQEALRGKGLTLRGHRLITSEVAPVDRTSPL